MVELERWAGAALGCVQRPGLYPEARVGAASGLCKKRRYIGHFGRPPGLGAGVAMKSTWGNPLGSVDLRVEKPSEE